MKVLLTRNLTSLKNPIEQFDPQSRQSSKNGRNPSSLDGNMPREESDTELMKTIQEQKTDRQDDAGEEADEMLFTGEKRLLFGGNIVIVNKST